MKHLRANLLLLGLTLAVCCVTYPVVLWAVGRRLGACGFQPALVRLRHALESAVADAA